MPTTIRTYLALTADQVRALPIDRFLEPPLVGFAPTAELSGSEREDAEFRASQLAAQEALQRGIPVVIAALEVSGGVQPADPASPVTVLAEQDVVVRAVTVSERIALSRVAALHIGDDVLEGASLKPGGQEPLDLSWYDTTEIQYVAQLLASPH